MYIPQLAPTQSVPHFIVLYTLHISITSYCIVNHFEHLTRRETAQLTRATSVSRSSTTKPPVIPSTSLSYLIELVNHIIYLGVPFYTSDRVLLRHKTYLKTNKFAKTYTRRTITY